MKKLLALVLLVLLCAGAMAEGVSPNPEGWSYVGYTHGGITFLVPEDMELWQLTDEEEAAGFVLMGGSDDFTLQLRCFTPDVMPLADFRERILAEPTSEVSFTGENGSILCYRNTRPTSQSELYGIVLEGLDGNMYKISIFTGVDGDCSPGAKVWEIARVIGESAATMDFSDWPIEENPAS